MTQTYATVKFTMTYLADVLVALPEGNDKKNRKEIITESLNKHLAPFPQVISPVNVTNVSFAKDGDGRKDFAEVTKDNES